MNVLLLTQFYWPEVRSAPMNLAGLAEDLQAGGHDVTVVTGVPNHPFGKIYEGYRLRFRQWEDVRGVRVLRVPLYPDHSLSSVRRLLHYGSFAISAATIGTWTTRRFVPDVILVYLPPWTNWLPIRVFKALRKAPVVCWVTDVWPESLQEVGNGQGRWRTALIDRLVKAVNRQASLTCVNAPGLKRLLMEKGMPESRLAVVTDWADEGLFFPVEPDEALAREHGLAGRFNIMYGGNLGAVQGLDTVVEAAGLLRDVPDLQVVFVGDGEDAARLRRLVGEQGLDDNVRFIGRQPMADMKRLFALADVLLLHLKPSPIFARQIPSKTMAYLACGKPVLCAISGDAAAIVEQAGAGVCSPPGDSPSMAAAIRRLYQMPAADRERFGRRGREAYLTRYTRSVQTRRVQTLLSQVVAGTLVRR